MYKGVRPLVKASLPKLKFFFITFKSAIKPFVIQLSFLMNYNKIRTLA